MDVEIQRFNGGVSRWVGERAHLPNHGQGGGERVIGGVGGEKRDVEDGRRVHDGVDGREVVICTGSIAMHGAPGMLGVGLGFGHGR